MGLEINQKLLPLKAHYYLFNAGMDFILNYVKFKVLLFLIFKNQSVRHCSGGSIYSSICKTAWILSFNCWNDLFCTADGWDDCKAFVWCNR